MEKALLFSLLGLFLCFLYHYLLYPILFSPLSRIPGPKSFAISGWRLAWEDWKGKRTPTIHSLHRKYGPVVLISPCEVSFNSLSSLKTIYGAGSPFERTSFYRMFDVYGHQNMFTFASSKDHARRKRILNHAYSKTTVLKDSALMVEEKARKYLKLLDREPKTAGEIYGSLHFFSLDAITTFLYGSDYGGTNALGGIKEHRGLLDDIHNPARRKLAWFAVHLPKFTKWLYSRTGTIENLVTFLGLLPMAKPATYTGIRLHALNSWLKFSAAASLPEKRIDGKKPEISAGIMGKLWKHHVSQDEGELDGLDIASECADQLLAGIDTTSDTIMFLIWAISLPSNRKFQERLVEEVLSLKEDAFRDGVPTVEACDKLVYLDALIKETLRLYAPLPASEPRSMPADSVIDGYAIPAGTVVSMAPYSLHRNPDVFPNPLDFNPERWFGEAKEVAEMKKWWWAFSSGGRMCIGIHLAMAEMKTLIAAIYSRYTTSVRPGYEHVAPGITSRFEVFSDERFIEISEHICWIDFHKR